jgi:hypothetical protein
MSRGRVCSICASREKPSIDGQLLAGVRLKDIATSMGLSAYSLSRHRRNCLTAPLARNNDDSQEIARWLLRAEEIYQASTINGDVRGMVASLTAALRSLEVRAKAKEREREQVSRDLPDVNGWTGEEAARFRAWMDVQIAEAAATPYASLDAKMLDLSIKLEERSDGHELMNLFQEVAQNPEFLTAARELCATRKASPVI